jgi:hypothetical protein
MSPAITIAAVIPSYSRERHSLVNMRYAWVNSCPR